MADNQPESGLSAETGTLTPQTSQPGGSSTSFDAEALAKVLQPLIKAEVERSQQSNKDKRLGKLEGKVSEFAEQLAQLKALQAEGWSEPQALRLMGIDQSGQPSREAELPKPHGSGAAVPGVDAQAVFTAMGYNTGGEEVTRVLREHPGDPTAQIMALANLKTQAAQVRQPNLAQVMTTGGGTSVAASDDVDGLTRKLSDLQKNPTANRKQMQELTKQLESLLPRR